MTAEIVPQSAGGTTRQPVPPAQMAAVYAEYQAAQNLLGVILIRDVLAQWAITLSDLSAVRAHWTPIRAAITAAVNDRHDVFWRMGLRFYAQVRNAAGVTSSVPEVLPVPLPPALVQATLDSTGPWTMLKAVEKGLQAGPAAEMAGVRLSGAASRLAIQGAREAVLTLVGKDQEAEAWARILGPRPCYFCAMLASRGPVYKTERSAGFQAHNHCMCVAVPVFSADQPVPGWHDLESQWQQATKGKSGQDARLAWRHYWDGRPAALRVAA